MQPLSNSEAALGCLDPVGKRSRHGPIVLKPALRSGKIVGCQACCPLQGSCLLRCLVAFKAGNHLLGPWLLFGSCPKARDKLRVILFHLEAVCVVLPALVHWVSNLDYLLGTKCVVAPQNAPKVVPISSRRYATFVVQHRVQKGQPVLGGGKRRPFMNPCASSSGK